MIPTHYRLAGEDEKAYVIHDARDGSKFKVAKAGIHPAAHTRIKKLQRFDDGGSVQPDAEPNPAPNNVQSASSAPSGPLGGASAPWTEDQPAQRAPASAPPPASVPNPMSLQATDLNRSLRTERNALVAGAQAEGTIAQKSAQAYGDLSSQLDQMLTPQQIMQNHKAADDELMKAYMNKSIDPDHYWKNQSTGSKIASAIGMILGGVGAAHGQPNYAMENINNSIARDIEAQKDDQSKAMNLWKMNREATQDDLQANLATHNQLLNSVKAKILQYESESGTALASARAAPAIAQIDQQMAQNNYRRALMSSGQVDPTQIVPVLVPPEHQKQALSEIGQAKAASANEDQIMKAFDQAAQDTRPMTGGPHALLNAIPGYHPASVKTLQLLGDPLIHDNEGRINEFEKNDFMNNLPQFGDSDETVAQKRAAMQQFINHKKEAPTANAFGINLERYGSTSSNPAARLSPQAQQIYAEAKSRLAVNPQDPVGLAAMKRLGIQ